MNLTEKIAIFAIIITILLWFIDRYFPKKPKYTIDQLNELFKEFGPISSNHIEIKGDNNKVILIEK